MTVAGRAPAGVPPAGRGVIFRTGPSLHELGIRIVAACGDDNSLGGVQLHVGAVGVLGDNGRDRAIALAHELHARGFETDVEIVVLLGNLLHLQAHVHARIARSHAGIRRQARAVVEPEFGGDEIGQAGHAAGRGSLLHFRNQKAIGALVQHGLPKIGGLARAAYVGAGRLGTRAPVGAAIQLIEQQLGFDVQALLALCVHGAEALETGATAGHFLDADHIGALLGRLQTRHESADAGAYHYDVVVFGRRDAVGGNGLGLKGDGATGAGAGHLLDGNPGRLVR